MDPIYRALLLNLPGFALPLLAFLNLKYARPNRPYGRILMLQAIGFAIWAVASTLWSLAFLNETLHWPSPIDALALLGYLAFILSAVLFLKLLHESGLVQGLGNSVLGALMVLAVYVFLMYGQGQTRAAGEFTSFVSLVYRFLDVLVLSLTTVNAVFLFRIRESFIGQFQLTQAVGFVLMALGNAFSIAVLLKTNGVADYSLKEAIVVTAFYTSSLFILTAGYLYHLVGIRRRFGGIVPDESVILRDALLGAYENALADLIEYVRDIIGAGAVQSVRAAAHKLAAGPSTEIEIAPSGLPTRTLSESEWEELLLAVRQEYLALGGAMLNPAFEKIRHRYGEKLQFLAPVPGAV